MQCKNTPKGDLTSVTAPAHPYATDAVVYTALFHQLIPGLIEFLTILGRPGPVIEVRAKTRTGEQNFISCLRESLQKRFGPSRKIVALGGTFVIGESFDIK